MKFTEAH